MSKLSRMRRILSHLTVVKASRSSSCRSSSKVSSEPENPQSMSGNGLNIPSCSYDSLKKLTGFVDNMNEDVGKLLLASERDLRKDPNLFTLVNDFFNTNSQLSDLCDSLRNCVEKAHRGETLVQEALSDFLEEKMVSGDGDASFRKTLQDLRSFNEYSSEDPFAGDFTRLFRSCHGELVKIIGKLNGTAKKLDRKLRRISLRRRVSITVFLGVITAVAVSAILVGLTVAPPVMAAGGALMAYVPVGSVGLFVSSLWQKSRSLLKRQRDAVDSMERGISVALSEVARISVLASQLEDLMKSMGETAMTAAEKRSPLTSAMEEVEKELTTYQTTINALQQETGRCNEHAHLSRDVAREKISRYLTRNENTNTFKEDVR